VAARATPGNEDVVKDSHQDSVLAPAA
jgi:hypothetical protein